MDLEWISNFQLLMLRAEDDPRIDGGLTKRTDEYTSADIQNEILKVMALQILPESCFNSALSSICNPHDE